MVLAHEIPLSRRSLVSAVLSGGLAAALRPSISLAKERFPSTLAQLTLHQASELVRTRKVSPVELTQSCLARINSLNPKINAFITVAAESALETAKAAEREIVQGQWRGALHGIPIALKDNIDTAGIQTTGASGAFFDRTPTEDAHVVARLKTHGAVMLGKLNMAELALGGSSTNSFWGPIHNPRSLNYDAGGSSGGSAAAVAADFCFGTLGTDTGGSIRIPSSFCGVVGLKPTYGLVSNRGLIPASTSLDHVGPICKTVLDAALLLQCVAGHDSRWSNSVNVGLPDYVNAGREGASVLRLGLLREDPFTAIDPEVARLVGNALIDLAKIAPVAMDDVVVPYGAGLFSSVMLPEYCEFLNPIFEKSSAQLQPFIKKFVTKSCRLNSVSGETYVKALRELHESRQRIMEVFDGGVDILALPTWGFLPKTLEETHRREFQDNVETPISEMFNIMTISVLGLPAISIPCGYTEKGLPVGLQLVGRPFAEPQILALAYAYEQLTPWHLRKPAL